MHTQRRAIGGRSIALVAALAALILVPQEGGRALEAPPSEAEALKACEKRLCTMILDKGQPQDAGDLVCIVSKTWGQSSLEGGKSKGIGWGFGDARCGAKVSLSRADIAAALTKPQHTIQVPEQMVRCVVERGGKEEPVNVSLAPKLNFKNGKADKVWINLRGIEGPADIRTTVSLAASLEDSLGIFHRPMIKSINSFMQRKCAKLYGPAAIAREERAKKKAEAAKRKAEAAKKKAEAARRKAEAGGPDAADGKPAADAAAPDPSTKPAATKPAATAAPAAPAAAGGEAVKPPAGADAKPPEPNASETSASETKPPETKKVKAAVPETPETKREGAASGTASPLSP